jgi:hypothetical protein
MHAWMCLRCTCPVRMCMHLTCECPWHSDMQFSINGTLLRATTVLPKVLLRQVGGEKKPSIGGISSFLAGFQKLMEAGQKDPFYAVVAYRNFRPMHG